MFWHHLGLSGSVLIDHMGSCLFLWTSQSVSRQLCWEKINIWESWCCYDRDTLSTLLWPFMGGFHQSLVHFSYKGPIIQYFDVSLMLVWLSCWWFEIPRCSCDITVMYHVVLLETQENGDAYESYTIYVYCLTALTHWGRNKMASIFQMTLWNAFSWMKMYKFRLSFHLKVFLSFEISVFQHWFR